MTYAAFVRRLKRGEAVLIPDGVCPVGVALEVFRGRWKADVLYRLCAGAAGFGDLLRQINGITRTMRTSTLRELEVAGVVARRVLYAGKVRRVEYSLSVEGEALLPVFYSFMKWGWKHSQTKGGTK